MVFLTLLILLSSPLLYCWASSCHWAFSFSFFAKMGINKPHFLFFSNNDKLIKLGVFLEAKKQIINFLNPLFIYIYIYIYFFFFSSP